MPFDDLSLRLKILVGLTAPPILTVLCWLIGRHWAGSQRECRAVLKSENFEYAVLLLYLIRFFRTFGAGGRGKT
jgi:hypothetical protein